mmetsp:Transcript_503/g.1205  ORF Transcript_503/g.1205 Transcript_503/m.1205 type:complete len:265 (+) Transcript_503:104-898(+)
MPPGGAPGDDQYVGLFRGLGVSSKEPKCSKKNSQLKQVHNGTHFAIGCKKWDDENRAMSSCQASFQDPQVVYPTIDCPDKNASIVELRQRAFVPGEHYRTEQRDRYENPGPFGREPAVKHKPSVHLGDDVPELVAHSHATHGRMTPDSQERAASLRCAGAGSLVPTSMWPKAIRCNPITGGPRNLELHDHQMAANMNFKKYTQDRSTVVMEPNVRDPIHGHHIPLEAYSAPVQPDKMYSSVQHVDLANASIPPLRSLGALRPHH